LAGLDFNDATKRETADALISRLAANEHTYQQTTIDLMLDVAALARFPDVEKIKEPDDRALRLREDTMQSAGCAPARPATAAKRKRGSGRPLHDKRKSPGRPG
jgi:hypothetical protein